MRLSQVFVAMMCVVPLLHAQEGGSRQRRTVEERVAELKTQLQLTDDQAAKVKTIFEKQRAEMQKMRDQAGEGDRESMREVFREMREKNEAEIQKLLTDPQKKKYEEIQAQRRARMGQRGPGRGGNGGQPPATAKAPDTTKAATPSKATAPAKSTPPAQPAKN